ncbi:MAG: DNA photolyase family protein [Polyangiaceae bacterium]|nr:DNA photolyase family protein [Polyangiaceae bacterium]
MPKRNIVWIRNKDLRIHDHDPLLAAEETGYPIAVYIFEPGFLKLKKLEKRINGHRYLLLSLLALRQEYIRRGSDLIILEGRAEQLLPQLAKAWKIDQVHAYRQYEPAGRAQENAVNNNLSCDLTLHYGETLLPAESLRNGSGSPYAVFTPFYKSFLRSENISPPRRAPRQLAPLPADIRLDLFSIVSDDTLFDFESALQKLSSHDSVLDKPAQLLPAGEKAARQRLKNFQQRLSTYISGRDRMDQEASSRLSADLSYGTLSVREVWHQVKAHQPKSPDAEAYLRQLVWREFAYSSLWDRPDLLQNPFREKYEGFPYQRNQIFWKAWCEGKTGYPIVDAAARELLATGYVHNRARMISASFATKHLLLPYQDCEEHYLRHLTDGDRALNNMGWQWSAGCGCDAQPYFRVFNPTSQAKKFDPQGVYIRRWVPELANLSNADLHKPREKTLSLFASNATDYPAPIVDHAQARLNFLQLAKEHLNPNSRASSHQRK